jgi:hypothetical protein
MKKKRGRNEYFLKCWEIMGLVLESGCKAPGDKALDTKRRAQVCFIVVPRELPL